MTRPPAGGYLWSGRRPGPLTRKAPADAAVATYKPIPDHTVKLTALRTGTLDLIDELPPKDVGGRATYTRLSHKGWKARRSALYEWGQVREPYAGSLSSRH